MKRRPGDRRQSPSSPKLSDGLARESDPDAERERASLAAREQAGDVTHLPLDRILDRPGGDTRPVDPRHVLGLAESIAALGLLEPIVVDVHGRLISGLNRRAALRLLSEPDANARVEAWLATRTADQPAPTDAERRRVMDLDPPPWIGAPVPVRLLRVNAETDPDRALAAELAENEHRAGYSPAEVRAWAERLAAAGFTRSGRGRPKRGERPLLPALSAVVGKSRQTLERILDDKSPDGQLTPRRMAEKRIKRLLGRLRRLAEEFDSVDLEPDWKACRELVARVRTADLELGATARAEVAGRADDS